MNTTAIEYMAKASPVCQGAYREPPSADPHRPGQSFPVRFKRKFERRKTLALMAVLRNGEADCLVVVEELSENGVRFGQIPAGFDLAGDRLVSMVLTPYTDLHLVLVPRWTQETRPLMYRSVGFEIIKPSGEWLRFVGQIKQEAGELAYLLAEEETGGIQ